MSLAAGYADAQRDESLARLRRIVALRAMLAEGMSQREVASALGVSQPAISQQLRSAPNLDTIHPALLVEAAGPILRRMADGRGYGRLAVFGSVARGDARTDSDIDLLVDPPEGTSISELLAMKDLLTDVLDRPVDLVTYGGLDPAVDQDVLRDAVLL